MNEMLPVVGVQASGVKEVRNVGVARITGAQLTAGGYNINWLYYIIDIGCLATYENQGRDCWLGAEGTPVAGTTTVFSGLGPAFEGQRFYNITTQTPLQYRNGSWGGTGWAGYQATSPTCILITTPAAVQEIAPAMHYVTTASDAVFQFAGGGRWLSGHSFKIDVAPSAVGCTATAAPGYLFVTISDPAGSQSINLIPGQEYSGVLVGTILYMFTDTESSFLRKQNNLAELEDKAQSRANLQVLSIAETGSLVDSIAADAGSGLVFQGTVSSPTTPRRVSVDFATPADLIAGTEGKVVGPSILQTTLETVVANALSASKYNALTGLMVSSAGFTCTAFSPVVLEYSGFEVFFNPDPSLLTEEPTQLVVNAGALGIPTAANWVLYDLVVDTTGAVFLSSSRTVLANTCRLAYVLAYDSQIVEVLPVPQISTSDSALRNSLLSFNGGLLADGSVVAGTLEAASYSAYCESCNWLSKVPSPHQRDVGAMPTLEFRYTNGITLDASTTVVDGRKLLAGSVTAGQFSVQRVFRSMSGAYYLVPTSAAYASMAAATAAIATLPANPISAFDVYCREVAYLVLRGDQYAGSAALDLADAAKFSVVPVATGTSAVSGGSGANKSAIVITSGGTLEANNVYLLATNDVVFLPLPTTNGLWVRIKVAYGFNPTLRSLSTNLRDTFDNTLDNEVVYDVPPESDDVYIARDNEWLY